MRYLQLLLPLLLFSIHTLTTLAIPFPNMDKSTNGTIYNISELKPDASVVWTNPAAMNNTDSVFNIALSLNAVIRNSIFQASEPSLYQAISDNPVLYPFQLNVSSKINSSLSLGLTVQPYNSEQFSWQEENWTGRFLIRDYNLNAMVIQPAISYRLSESVSVGAGLVITGYQLRFNRSLPLRDINNEARQTINGKSIKLGLNLGISAILNQYLNISLNYKSGQLIKFNDSEVSNSFPGSLQYAGSETTSANIEWVLPENINFSATYQINEKWVTNANLAWFFYLNENKVDVKFPAISDFMSNFSIIGSNEPEIVYQLGVSFFASDYFTFRAGSWYSQGNTDENFLFPVLVNGPRIGLYGDTSFMAYPGLSINISIASAYFFKKSGTYSPGNFGGSYKTLAFSPGLGINYSF